MMYNNYLEHHGIKGQKWGVRRFQREDGTLTPAGKKRYNTNDPKDREKLSRMYRSHINTAAERVNKDPDHLYVRAYNATAERFNGENGLIAKYNKEYYDKLSDEDKKRDDWGLDDAYNQGFQKMFDKEFDKSYKAIVVEDLTKDKYYKKAEELAEEYSMREWDEFAKEVASDIAIGRKYLKEVR